ncbi:MAG: hypothetical protein ACLQU3_25845, partial [Limisphaerales bacterium]
NVAGSDSQTRQNIQSQCEHSHRQIYTKLNDDAGAASCFSTTKDSAPVQNPALCQAEGEHWRWCPRCGHELNNEKCKLRCPRCQYSLSCSDFD